MLFGPTMSSAFAQKDSPQEFVIGKGTNLAHWLSQSRQRGEERRLFIQEKDIDYIADLGFEHVRLPIDEEQMWDDQGNRHNDAFEKAKELNLPLYCGEYGVLKGAPEEDRLRWYNDMMEIFEDNNVGSANWNYKSGSFGLVNGDGSKNQDLIEIVSLTK